MPAVSIHDQADEVEREVRNREHLYPIMISRGRIKPDTAETKLEHLRAASATMRLIAEHADGLRELIRFLRAKASTEDEKLTLLHHPAVVAVLKEFPDAQLISAERMSDDQDEGQAPNDE